MRSTIFLFGESEKGEFGIPLFCRCLPELCDLLGNPPEESQGIPYAIQALLYNRLLFFCRVREEGFSIADYLKGFHIAKQNTSCPPFQAIALPGVGSEEIIEAAGNLCSLHKSLLILTEKDLYERKKLLHLLTWAA